MLLSQKPSEPPTPSNRRRRRSLTANMATLMYKIQDKVSSSNKSRSRNSPSDSPDRSIPPEPVQTQPHGDFSAHDAAGAMQAHNLARANKRCPKLEWSAELARDAEAYAQTLAEKGRMEHSGVEGQGENLYMSSGTAELDDAVQAWLGEEKEYRGEKVGEGELGKWGHFSELAWSSCRCDEGADVLCSTMHVAEHDARWDWEGHEQHRRDVRGGQILATGQHDGTEAILMDCAAVFFWRLLIPLPFGQQPCRVSCRLPTQSRSSTALFSHMFIPGKTSRLLLNVRSRGCAADERRRFRAHKRLIFFTVLPLHVFVTGSFTTSSCSEWLIARRPATSCCLTDTPLNPHPLHPRQLSSAGDVGFTLPCQIRRAGAFTRWPARVPRRTGAAGSLPTGFSKTTGR